MNYGKLFRSAVVASGETWIDPLIAKNLGIRHQVEFRSDAEADYITESTLGSGIRYHRIPLEMYYADCISTESSDYENIKKVFRTIIEAAVHDEGVIYNCSLGRDRTGTVTFMLLALLGVARADIDKDYELTGFSYLNTPAYRTSASYRAMAAYLSSFGGATLRDHVVWWFIKAGFGLAELNAFRAAMTNGTPDELTADHFVATYSVTNFLTGCANTNPATSAESETAYSATITLTDGYNTIHSVSVKMGGADVTEDVYADGIIHIASVTGDIVITAVASYVPAYTNQIPISTDTDGSIFNGVGYQHGYRINSTGGLTEASSVYVTGFIPCATGDVVRFKNYTVNSNSDATGELRVGFYDSSKNVITDVYWSDFFDADDTTFDSSGHVTGIVVPAYTKAVAFARFANFDTNSKSIITVNEEIE